MNALDSRRFVGLLARDGFVEAPEVESADVVLLNTCSVREKAEEKVYARLGRLGRMKERRPQMVLGVCGCVAQQEGEQLLDRIPFLDFVLGPGRIEGLPAVLRRVREEGDRPVEVGFDPGEVAYTPGNVARIVAFRASITVMEGCNKNCTFCVVPATRGRERNRRLADVVREAAGLVRDGVVEIELLGQTVNAFRDPETGQGFAELLRAVGAIPGLSRLRFVTSHPKDFDADLIRAMAETAAVCPALHLPVQSGSTRVLRRMKRQYGRAEYLALAERIRSAMPAISLYTDVIVGFPGETEEDFDETLSLLDEVRFAGAFTFSYSPRPFTAAARWAQDVSVETSRERLSRLMEKQLGIQLSINSSLVGSSLQALVEGKDRKKVWSAGRSTCNRVVNVESRRILPPGSFVDVVVTRAFPNSLVAIPLAEV
jgi:tRNA-2-methylthio-N6-dimethylallyladenosine synthase